MNSALYVKTMSIKTDFKHLHDMPTEYSKLKYTRSFNSDEYSKLKLSLSAQSMDEKWNVYIHEEQLCLHRSWTGHCIYSVNILETTDGCKAECALVNRNPDQYNASDDSYDLLLLDFLISNLLLGENKPFPNNSYRNEAAGIIQHTISGTGYKEISVKQADI